ncbi:uncharacterized protein KQ657_000019 [Scheffersomyces spartinae]|uniref:Protein kinase domain-containing protein n=1 Tax=Scheffersomyces spartinae TaxID=45513 RepID=A0A9P7VEK7_9ASCO|nr:uncharacterized protein KQ657_000019 [Scheffersomyces spartinae]KAG7196013.1 hypothetical protein KQ657_000019 [Scheffersomyces spartinae]
MIQNGGSAVPPPQVPINAPAPLLDGLHINSKYQFVRKIGAGTYGLIYLVQDPSNGHQYAAKMVLKDPPNKVAGSKDTKNNKNYIQRQIHHYFSSRQGQNSNDYDDPQVTELDLNLIKEKGVQCPFLREIALNLRVHDHPNIVTIHKVLNIADLCVLILMDYCDQGDLFGNIIDKQIFQKVPPYQDQQTLMKNCMLQLVDTINYCHRKSVYHCDLKPENIMVKYNPNYRRSSNSPIIDYNEIQIVLIDFGLAMLSNLICCNACRGSSFYMAPERITNYNTNALIKSMIDMREYESVPQKASETNESNRKYFPTLAGDIWSLGVLFINITCSRNPWPIANIANSYNADNTSDSGANNQVFQTYIFHNRNILKSILPILTQYNRLLDKIFQLNPSSRVSLPQLHKEIIEIDFFQDFINPTVVRNEQLYTPPETDVERGDTEYDTDYYDQDDIEVDSMSGTGLASPVPSEIYLEQCQKQLKLFSCPHHHHHENAPHPYDYHKHH